MLLKIQEFCIINGGTTTKYTFFYKKTIFFLEPYFSYHNSKNQAEIFLILFLTCISLFSLIVYLVRFNTNNKRHFLAYMLNVFLT